MSTTAVGVKAPHALYRFYDATDNLLYIGLTVNVGARFTDHRGEKPWWTEISRITLEHFPDRPSVTEAERKAIVAEKPRHNIQHNGGRSNGGGKISPATDRVRFGLEVGFVVALITDLPGGTQCYVGQVEALDDLGVRVTLLDWFIGMFTSEDLFVTWPHVLGAAVWTEQHTIDMDRLAKWQDRIHGKLASAA